MGRSERHPKRRTRFRLTWRGNGSAGLRRRRRPAHGKWPCARRWCWVRARTAFFPCCTNWLVWVSGGRIGSGKQFVSWIHEDDYCRAVEWVIAHDELIGPINLAAPNPLTNSEMMHTLRRACRMPFGLPAPSALLELGAFVLGTETELVIKSRRVVPRRLSESGFQ